MTTALDVLARLRKGDYSTHELRCLLAWFAGHDPKLLDRLLDDLA